MNHLKHEASHSLAKFGAILGVGAAAVGFAAYEIDNFLNSIHPPHIHIGTPKIGRLTEPHPQFDFKASISDIRVPSEIPVGYATAKGHSYLVDKSVSTIPVAGWLWNNTAGNFTGCSANVTRQEQVEIDLPYSAVMSTKTYSLPGSTTEHPKKGLLVNIDATKLETKRSGPSTLYGQHGGNCGFLTRVANVFTDSEAKSGVPVVENDVTDQLVQDVCAQSMTPGLQALTGLAFKRLFSFAANTLESQASATVNARSEINSDRELASEPVEVNFWLPSQSTEISPQAIKFKPPQGLRVDKNYNPDPVGEIAAGLHTNRRDITTYKTDSYSCSVKSSAAYQMSVIENEYKTQLASRDVTGAVQ